MVKDLRLKRVLPGEFEELVEAATCGYKVIISSDID
jgi:hypothetical protein